MPYTPPTNPKYQAGRRRASLPVIQRALRLGWQWWQDPRRGLPCLHSPAGRLYAVQHGHISEIPNEQYP